MPIPEQELNRFGSQTYSSPSEAFIASQMLPWPRKPLGGKGKGVSKGTAGRNHARHGVSQGRKKKR